MALNTNKSFSEQEKPKETSNFPNAIEIINLNKSYGAKKVLEKVNFVIKKGTIHGFIGPNGSGKTTTMCMIVKLSPLEKGSDIKIYGKSIRKDDYTNKYIGFAPSEVDIMKEYEVEEYILSYNILRGLEEDDILRKIDNSPLDVFRRHKLKNLSTGWRKIVQIFNISLSKPEIFILDEPFNGLDPEKRKDLFDKLIKMKGEGKTILISTHILSDLQKMADNITMIKKGKVVFNGPITEDIESTYKIAFEYREEENPFA